MEKGKSQPRSRPRSPPETRPQKSRSTSNKIQRRPDSGNMRRPPQEPKPPTAEAKDEARTEMEVTMKDSDDLPDFGDKPSDYHTVMEQAAASSSTHVVTDPCLPVVKGPPENASAEAVASHGSPPSASEKPARVRKKRDIAHTAAWQKILKKTAPNGTRRARPCKFYTQGWCSSGNDCHFAHLPTCSYWKEGKCVLEDKCVFPHWEPQSPEVEKPQQYDII